MDTHEQDNIISDIKDRVMQTKQSILSQFAEIEAKLENFHCSTSSNLAAADPPRPSIIANGKPCDPAEFESIKTSNYKHYDIVLDIPNRSLLARRDPENHSPLEECSCKGFGPQKMIILQHLLKHPEKLVGSYNILEILDKHKMTPNTLAQSICTLRNILQPDHPEKSYIETVDDWNQSVSCTGKAYKLNPKWHYLVLGETIL